MPFQAPPLRLHPKQRNQLLALTRRQNAAEVLRARIILELASGASYAAIGAALRTANAHLKMTSFSSMGIDPRGRG